LENMNIWTMPLLTGSSTTAMMPTVRMVSRHVSWGKASHSKVCPRVLASPMRMGSSVRVLHIWCVVQGMSAEGTTRPHPRNSAPCRQHSTACSASSQMDTVSAPSQRQAMVRQRCARVKAEVMGTVKQRSTGCVCSAPLEKMPAVATTRAGTSAREKCLLRLECLASLRSSRCWLIFHALRHSNARQRMAGIISRSPGVSLHILRRYDLAREPTVFSSTSDWRPFMLRCTTQSTLRSWISASARAVHHTPSARRCPKRRRVPER